MKFAPLILLLSLAALANAATRAELQIQPTGPLQLSPWRAAADVSNPNYDHYIYSSPPFCGYFCGWCGYGGYGFYGYRGFGFANPLQAFIINAPGYSR
jgi:hypothetical protein